MQDRKERSTLAIAFEVMFSRPSLALMMFLQYAIWGAWSPTLSAYLGGKLGFEGPQTAQIYSAFPLMTLLVPITAGQLADRWLPAQRALTIFHLLGGIVLFVMAQQAEFGSMNILMLVYAFLYTPTLALTNSVAFRNLDDPQREFGPIRVWGTIGWIVAGWVLTMMREQYGSLDWTNADLLMLAGVLSILMAVMSFLLPNTPPETRGTDPLAFRKAFVLFKDRNYLIFFIIAFIVATELMLYYVLTGQFLQQIGPAVGKPTLQLPLLGTVYLAITPNTVPAWMTVAQLAEIFAMAFLLPAILPKWGVRNAMLLGIIAWPIRYLIFALTWSLYKDNPTMVWLSIAALTLHGFCYVFFFVVAFIYTDMVAPKDIRSSAQALINLAVLGLGMLIGTYFAGWLQGYFTTEQATVKVTNWTGVFIVPTVITFLAAIIFTALFRESRETAVET